MAEIIPFRPAGTAVPTPSGSPLALSDAVAATEARLDQASANLGVAEALGRQVAGQLLHYVRLLDQTKDFCDQCTAATELDDLAEMVRRRDALAHVWNHEWARESPQASGAAARR